MCVCVCANRFLLRSMCCVARSFSGGGCHSSTTLPHLTLFASFVPRRMLLTKKGCGRIFDTSKEILGGSNKRFLRVQSVKNPLL